MPWRIGDGGTREYYFPPFGGGSDIQSQYGCPLPPSKKTWYPFSTTSDGDLGQDRSNFLLEKLAFDPFACFLDEYKPHVNKRLHLRHKLHLLRKRRSRRGVYLGMPQPDDGSETEYGGRPEYQQPPSKNGSGRKPEYDGAGSVYGSGDGQRTEYGRPSENGSGYGGRTESYGSVYGQSEEQDYPGRADEDSGYGGDSSYGSNGGDFSYGSGGGDSSYGIGGGDSSDGSGGGDPSYGSDGGDPSYGSDGGDSSSGSDGGDSGRNKCIVLKKRKRSITTTRTITKRKRTVKTTDLVLMVMRP